MNDFENRIKHYIETHTTLSATLGPVIIALSGGADSVALLAVMTRLGYDCVAAHCNFHLRGSESDRDMTHAKTVADRLGARFELIDFDVDARREKTGESIEMACRELRYDWFGQLKSKYNAQAVVTGHHRDDNIETLFLNLLRGSGLNGLAAIWPEGDRRVSPLLGESRESILRYLDGPKLDYVTDSTNLETEYRRNKIRNIILPVIESEFPGAMQRMGDSLGFLAEDRELLNFATKQWKSEATLPDGDIDLTVIARHGRLANAVIYKILQPYGFNRATTDSIMENPQKSGLTYRSASHTAITSRGKLRITPNDSATENDIELRYKILDRIPADIRTRGKDTLFLDSTAIDGNPLWEIREWHTGDRMQPFGMNGRSKKVSDIFNDMKISVADKHRLRLLTRNGEIMWIIGLRATERFRVTDASRAVVEITVGGNGGLLCVPTP